jgi:hypothetical protein
MIITNIGIALNTGVVPPLTKPKAKITAFGVSKDFGSIPPKNFFRAKISTVDISGEVTGLKSILFYQIN